MTKVRYTVPICLRLALLRRRRKHHAVDCRLQKTAGPEGEEVADVHEDGQSSCCCAGCGRRGSIGLERVDRDGCPVP